jgi:hypothetical protein
MGIIISYYVLESNQLSGGVQNGIPTVSYAYGSGNNFLLGADATYTSVDGFPNLYQAVGEITPFLIQLTATTPTLICAPITVAADGQSLNCSITGTSLDPGLYTISFFQYLSTSYSEDDAVTTYYTKADVTPNTLGSWEDGCTYSFVHSITTTTTTPSPTEYTTITSGVSEILPTSTATIPSSIVTIPVYQTTIVSSQTSKSTLYGASTVITKTGTYTKKATSTVMKCNQDNVSSPHTCRLSSGRELRVLRAVLAADITSCADTRGGIRL